MNKTWKVNDIDKKRAEEISKKFNLEMLASNVLANKDLSDEEIEIFLNPTRNNFHDPFLMPDMKIAVDRILKAIENNEKILIYGDYDADGITSTTILKRFFNDRNIDVGTYIPNRLDEGYGLNKDAIESIKKDDYKLIITVDTGITANEQIVDAKNAGIDVIVTDHHEPGEELPDAIAVVDCKRKDNKYPFRELAGCGVAFKLICALAQKLELNENEALKYIDLACVGTISDIVPLEDENRIIAKLGLLLLKQTRNLGLRELIRTIGFKEITSETISFGIAPRINACGRMGHQEVALNLFTSDDPIKVREYAYSLEEYNKERQAIEKRIYEESLKLLEKENIEDKSCIVLGNTNWHNGVIGIVSSKITDKYYKPSLLICFEDNIGKGSGRSIPGFDLHEALTKCSSNLESFGGHSMAVGLKLKKEKYEAFKKEIEEYTKENIKEDVLDREILIDQELQNKDITIHSVRELELLEPFGEGNQEPIVLYKNLKIESIRTLSEGKHIKLNLKNENIKIDAIGFNMGQLANEYLIGDKVDVVGNIKVNTFNNFETIQITLIDIRKSL